jgi:endonuclease YncB( thermonuclease family)
MLDDAYQPLAQLDPAGFSRGVLAGIDAGLAVAARDRPQTIAGWRPILGMSAAPAGDTTVVIGKTPEARPEVRPDGRHVSTLPPPPSAAGPSRTGLWIGVAVVLLALLGGGGYYAIASRGPDPEMVKARAAAEEAEAKRLKAEQEAAKLRADNEQRLKAEQATAALKQQQDADAAAKKQLEDETRRKIENELAAQKRADEDAKRKADEEADARRKAVDDARKAVEFVAGNFDHFGKTLMTIGLKDRPDEIRLQGVDIVNDPALHKLAVDALATQPRNLHCRQTDRLTDGTPLYRCLVTRLNAKEPLADIPDADRDDLALALVRNGLVLASCDAPRSYADAEDDARGRKQSLWGRVTVPEYKRRCTK